MCISMKISVFISVPVSVSVSMPVSVSISPKECGLFEQSGICKEPGSVLQC